MSTVANAKDAVREDRSARDGPQRRFSCAPELIFLGTAVLLVSIRIWESREIFRQIPGTDWNSSEWMIDYAGGFVRRGLGGELLSGLMHLTGLSFFAVWVTATTAVYLALCVELVRRSLRLRCGSLWRLLLCFNPGLLMFGVEAAPLGSFLRKDFVFVAATVLNVLLIEGMFKMGARSKSLFLPISAAVIGLVALFLALMHEGLFLFTWLPLNLFLLTGAMRRLGITPLKAALMVGCIFLPSLTGAGLSIRCHGDPKTAEAICRSWHDHGAATRCDGGPDFPAAVDGLGWSLQRSVTLTRSAWRRAPLFLLPAGFAIAIFFVTTVAAKIPLQPVWALTLATLTLSAPLYWLGWDWGRFFTIVLTEVTFVALSPPCREAAYAALPACMRQIRRCPQDICLRAAGVAERWPAGIVLGVLLLAIPNLPSKEFLLESPFAVLVIFIRDLMGFPVPRW